MTINIIDNGYKAEGLQEMLATFNRAAEKTFGAENIKLIEHFYYGDRLSMTDIVLQDRHYGQYSITAHGVHFNGHTCTKEQYKLFRLLTHDDPFHMNKLMEIAG